MIKTLIRLFYIFGLVCIVLLVMSLFMDKPEIVQCRNQMTSCFRTMQQTHSSQLASRGAYCLWSDIKCTGSSFLKGL